MTDHSRSAWQVAIPLNPKGWWIIGKSNMGQTQFAMFRKPNRLHQLMTKILLGWDWLDNE